MMCWLKRLVFVVTTLALTLPLSLPALADSDWYWHYTPADGAGHGIGLSQPTGDRVGDWQVRLNVGYEIDYLGLTFQRHQQLLDNAPDWYLASGIRVGRHFLDDGLTPCSLMDCPHNAVRGNGEWASSLFTRWTWGYTMTDARLDMGYGVQFQTRRLADEDQWAWAFGPTIDVILGFRL